MGVARGEDIAERFLDFAVRIIKMARVLSQSPAGRHIYDQIVRSGTSAGANYEEARGAESDRDFCHKLGICLKELRETLYWMRLIERADLIPAERMREITQEATELSKIIGKSISTSKKRTGNK